MSTQETFNTQIKFWYSFCNKFQIPYLAGSEKMYTRFAQWLFTNYPISGHQISKYITAVQHLHKCNYISLNRKTMGTLGLQLKYLKKTRPKKSQPHRPIVAKIIRKWLPLFNNSIEGITIITAMCIAYNHALRAGEYTCSKKQFNTDPRFRLNWEDCKVGYLNNTPRVLQITIKLPKSYNYKFVPELTVSECTCKSVGFCALHQYLRLWNFIQPKDLTQPLLCLSPGRWLTPSQMNTNIKKSCNKIKLEAAFYAPHGFRSGKCTDLKIQGIDDTIICKIGRWGSSEVWKKHYLLLDLFDVLRFSRFKC